MMADDPFVAELKRRLCEWGGINVDRLSVVDTGSEISIYAPIDDRALHKKIRDVIGYGLISVRRGDHERIMVPKSAVA